jgi:hypothetical protein
MLRTNRINGSELVFVARRGLEGRGERRTGLRGGESFGTGEEEGEGKGKLHDCLF